MTPFENTITWHQTLQRSEARTFIEMKGVVEQVGLRLTAKKVKNVSLPTLTTMTITKVAKERRGEEGNAIEKAFNHETQDHLHALIAKMIYRATLPLSLARNLYFIQSYTYAVNHAIGGYLPPGHNLLRTTLTVTRHIENLLEPIRSTWKERGSFTVRNSWSDSQRMPLINVMVVIKGGPMFLNVVNADERN